MNKQQPTSNKKMSFASIYFLGINAIVGSGAFLLPQEMYKDIGVLSILVLVCAAFTVSMIALCYADLSSRFSGSGAAWLYSYNAFGKYTGFQVGIFSWFLGSLTLSAEVVALLRILRKIFPALNQPVLRYAFPMTLILILAIINLFGTRIVKYVNNVSSVFKILTIVFFIVAGAFFIKSSNFSPVVPTDVTNLKTFNSHFGSAFSVVFYMFTGFSFIPVAASQMDNPQKNIPKALITVMLSVTILYVLVQAVSIGILGPTIVNYDIPIAEALKSSLGQWAYALIIAGMVVSIFGLAFAVSFSTPALVASLATEHDLLPSFLGETNKNGAPVWAIVVTAVISCLLSTFDYLFIVAGIVLASFIQYVPSVLALIKFKKNKQFPNDGFSLKGGYTIPIIALIISAYLLTNVNIKSALLILAVFVIGNILYFATGKNKKASLKNDAPPATAASKKIT